MKKLLVLALVLAVAGMASAYELATATGALAADLTYYVPYNQTSGNVTAEMIAGEDGLAMSCYNTSQGEYLPGLATPVFEPGVFGNALNGSDGWMDMHLVAHQGATEQAITMSFWMKRDTSAVYDTTQNRDGGLAYLWEVRDDDLTYSLDESLIDFTTTMAVDYQQLQVDHRDGEEKIKVGYNGGGGWAEFAGITDAMIRDGQWHNIVVTYEGFWGHQPEYGYQATDIEIWIDGSSIGKIHNANGWGSNRIEAFGFGTHYAKSGMGIADDVDDLGIFTRRLTQAEIDWIATIPEPATMALLGLGGLALIRRKK